MANDIIYSTYDAGNVVIFDNAVYIKEEEKKIQIKNILLLHLTMMIIMNYRELSIMYGPLKKWLLHILTNIMER